MRRMIRFLMMMGLLVSIVGCGDDDNPASSSDSDYVCDVTSNKNECVGCSHDELKAADSSSLSSACKTSLRYFEAVTN